MGRTLHPCNIFEAIDFNLWGRVEYFLEEDPQTLNYVCSSVGTPLMWASTSHNLGIVEYLISRGAEIDKEDKNGCTALMLACKEGHTHIVESLLSHGAKIDKKDKNSCTPLMYAS